MATVHIEFDGGDVAVLTGARPGSADQPIADPTDTGYVTNKAFIVAAGTYCFGLACQRAHAPLWQIVQAVDGTQEPTKITFKIAK